MAEQDRQVGKRLKALREQKGWSRETLAYHSDVSTKTVERIETGRVEGRRGTIRALAEALEVDVYAILGEPADPAGVPLSTQVDDVASEFRGLVQQIIDRDTTDRRKMYEKLDAVEQAIAARVAHDEHVQELLSQQNELLAQQADLLDMIRKLLGLEPEATPQARAVQAARTAAARSARPPSAPAESS